MSEALNILLVEDNQAISAAYKAIFEGEGNQVFCAFDADEALRLLNENPTFGFDLLFTDIDLVGDPEKGADKSGISFACYAHRVMPNVPVVGHSAYFDNDDITIDERACFDEWFPKGIKTAEREIMFDRALSLAKSKRKLRINKLSNVMQDELSDSLNVPCSSKEFELLDYKKDIIDPCEFSEFINPFAVWRRESEEGCELEVVGYPALIAWGENRSDAYEHLFDFIKSNKDLAKMSDEALGGSSLQIAKFIREAVNLEEVK